MSLKIKKKYRVLPFRWIFFGGGGCDAKGRASAKSRTRNIIFYFHDLFVRVYEITVLWKDDGHQSISILDFPKLIQGIL